MLNDESDLKLFDPEGEEKAARANWLEKLAYFSKAVKKTTNCISRQTDSHFYCKDSSSRRRGNLSLT